MVLGKQPRYLAVQATYGETPSQVYWDGKVGQCFKLVISSLRCVRRVIVYRFPEELSLPLCTSRAEP